MIDIELHSLISNDIKSNFEKIIDVIVKKLSAEFNSDITTFGIITETIINGEVLDYYYEVIHSFSGESLPTTKKQKIDNYLQKEIKEGSCKKKPANRIFFGLNDCEPKLYQNGREFYQKFSIDEFEYLLNDNPVLLIPIQASKHKSNPKNATKCIGLLYMRPRHNNKEYGSRKKLKEVAFNISLIIENLLYRKISEKLNKFNKSIINLINQRNEHDFYKELTELIRNTIGSEETTILIKDDYKQELILKYTTAESISVAFNSLETSSQSDSFFDKGVIQIRSDKIKDSNNFQDFKQKIKNDNWSIKKISPISEAIETRNSILIQCPDQYNCFDGFIELSLDQKSFLISPILSSSNVLGIIKCTGKKRHLKTSKNYYTKYDKELLENISSTISCLIEIMITTKKSNDFLHDLRHEIRLPVHVIYQNVEIISLINRRKGGNAIPDWIQTYLERITQEATLFTNIYANIDLLYSSNQDIAINMSLSTISGILKKVLISLKSKVEDKNCRIKIIDKTNGLVNNKYMFDRYRTTQVLLNIVSNAIKYSNFASQIEIIYSQDKGNHNIKVCDWGIGVENDIKDKMFELYFRGQNALRHSTSGNGIGLTVAKQISKKLGGDIVLEKSSEPTIFTFLLPIK